MTESIPRPNTIPELTVRDALALLSSMDKSAPNFLHTICKVPEPAQSLLDVSISDASSDEHDVCIICKEMIPYRILYQHAYDHLQRRPFLCTCGFHFRSVNEARRHAHSETRPAIHRCSFCDRCFKRKDALRAHERRIHSQPEPNIEESPVNADTMMRPMDLSGLTSPTPSYYEANRHISGAVGAPPPQITVLKVKDIDEKYIDVPLYQPLPWQELCSLLIQKQVLAKQHLSSGDCVVYTPDGRVLFGQDWDNWIALAISSSNDNIPAQLQVELRIVRKSCCEKLSERDQDVCNNCSAPLFDRDYLPPSPSTDTIELVPIPVANIPHSEIQQSLTSDIPDESRGITTSTSIDITYHSQNSIVRRRKQQPSSEESGEELRGSPPTSRHPQQEDAERDENVGSRSNTSHRFLHVLLTLYLYLIKPHFIAPRCMSDDIFHSEKLDLHLSFLRSWILGINAYLFGGAWAILALTSASESPILQTFVQLSASFAFFGIVFGLLLSYNICMMKDLFVQWVTPSKWNRGNEGRVSVWNPTIMLNLPLTWTAWACLNMVLFMLLYAWSTDPPSSPSVAKSIPGAFTNFVILWSVFYVYMIQREIWRCKSYPWEEV